MIAVPSIFIVAPRGIEKEAYDLSTPYFDVTSFKVYGIDALLLDVLKVNIIIDLIFLKNVEISKSEKIILKRNSNKKMCYQNKYYNHEVLQKRY